MYDKIINLLFWVLGVGGAILEVGTIILLTSDAWPRP